MNNGIKNKLKELIGETVEFVVDPSNGVFQIHYPPTNLNYSSKLLRIEDEDCVVLDGNGYEMYLSIDHISSLILKKT
jgi:hypothetical protein